MQLFHIEKLEIKGKEIIISQPEIIEQCRKVLRLKIGDIIFVQTQNNNQTTRYELQISSFTDKIIGETLSVITPPVIANEMKQSIKKTTMLIAIPNKREKAELITQKLTEIGISNIYFRPAERSIIKERNTKKEERLFKIAKEALEQSRGRHFPNISFIKNPTELFQNQHIIIFDKSTAITTPVIASKAWQSQEIEKTNTIGIIGPEGGLTPKDYSLFPNHEVISLGETILRMETAAIIGARLLKN